MSVHTEIVEEMGVVRPISAGPLRLRSRIARVWATVRRPFILAVICIAIITTVASEAYSGPALLDFTVRRALGGAGFDFTGWELNALGQKANALIDPPGAGLSEAEQSALVLDYFSAMARIRTLNQDIRGIYADPNVTDHAATAAPLEAELAELRDQQAARRPAVERILERQTAAVLAEEGLATPGGVLPPVRYHFTESPNLLIVSPRDRIATEASYHVDPALPLDRIEGIEDNVAQTLDVSTLIEGTGGISTYPTMVVEEPNLEWVLSTVAHEWSHTYLFFRPLGRSYYNSGETRTLNETTASIIGDEIAQRVLLRYYPDMVKPDPWPRPLASRPFWWAQNPEDRPFEFGPFMRETRLEADRLLAEGKIDEAEAYMEARRQILVAQGYGIRKLNQAYFAFHGSYAVGSAATDPIGAKLRALRMRLPGLAEFVHTVADMTSGADLDAALSAAPN